MSPGARTPRLYAAGAAIAACAIVALAAVLLRERPYDAPPAPAERRAEAAPSGGEPEAYEATISRRFERGGETWTQVTRFARMGDRARVEWTAGGRRFASITRPDRGVEILVDLDRDLYVERPLGGPAPEGADAPTAAEEADAPGAGASVGGAPVEEVEALLEAGAGAAVSRERVGTETVGGHECAVYRARIASPLGGVSESTVWEAPALGGLALRSELRGADGSRVTTELSGVSTDPDPAAFEVPPSARRVERIDRP